MSNNIKTIPEGIYEFGQTTVEDTNIIIQMIKSNICSIKIFQIIYINLYN